MNSKIRSVQKLFWAVLLVGTSVDVRGVESTPSMTTDKNRVMETTASNVPLMGMQEPTSTEEAAKRLEDAAKKGELERVKELTHKVFEEHVGKALRDAVEEGHVEMCEVLFSSRPIQIPHGYHDWEPSDQRKTDTDTIHMDTMTGNPTKRQKTDHESN